jgi:hypothetical protein
MELEEVLAQLAESTSVVAERLEEQKTGVTESDRPGLSVTSTKGAGREGRSRVREGPVASRLFRGEAVG